MQSGVVRPKRDEDAGEKRHGHERGDRERSPSSGWNVDRIDEQHVDEQAAHHHVRLCEQIHDERDRGDGRGADEERDELDPADEARRSRLSPEEKPEGAERCSRDDERYAAVIERELAQPERGAEGEADVDHADDGENQPESRQSGLP